ncbi:hypothetical protein J3R83DRAFT_7461 [Lanmaoa asiatica]|nr:hypothetical protein J3R83DRAFT_7461 [Lanmaoa asiatica]
MRPTTPDRQVSLDVSISVAGDLHSTPQSLGSAARGKDLANNGVKAEDVHPWIARDIEYAETCELDLMLQSCLLDCMADDQTMEDATSLFKKCLNLVLPICNGEAMDSKEIGKQLAAYCTAKYETELYPRFTRAANTALICLRNLAIDGLRDAPKKDTDQLFFHVGRRQIAQSYQEQRSIRKPDVVLVSAADFKSDSATDSKRSDDADKSPKKNFQWRSVRAAVEFKYRRGLKAPPSTYTVQYTTPSHHASQKSTDGIEPENDSSATCSSERNDGHEAQSDRESGFAVSQSSQATTGKKRKAEGERSSHDALRAPSNQVSSSKRLRVENLEAEPKKVDADVQVGMYGADMFASHTAWQHVFCLLITGCDITIWRYDRQGAIKTSKLNFIQDLPRFLVLLLAMQRFQNRNWGLHPKIDSHFGDASLLNEKVLIDHPEARRVEVTLDHSMRIPHYGLNGRATNICSALFGSWEFVAKMYWGEESRMSEEEILRKVYKIAETEPDVKNHVPEMVFAYKFLDSSTSTIRQRLNIPTEGARVLYIILFEKLNPITTLHGDEFLTCWWHTVKCDSFPTLVRLDLIAVEGHLALWRHGIHHRDVSASNLMSKSGEGVAVGVLNDFDLATVQGTVRGNERTGTIPFMAIELLSEEGLAGHISHKYEHDLESFLWVLVWICLRYDKGKLRAPGNRPLDKWGKVDAPTCGKEKLAFLLRPPGQVPGDGYNSAWKLALACCMKLREHIWSLSPTPSAASFEEVYVKPFGNLIGEPIKNVTSTNEDFVKFPAPCNFHEVTAAA